MKAAQAIKAEKPTPEKHQHFVDGRSPRPEASSVYDLSVLVCRIEEGETRARAANLPLPERRASTVRESLQLVVEQARSLINECLARDNAIPWIDPPALPEDNESLFVVPLVM
jgi:hypothetical protein